MIYLQSTKLDSMSIGSRVAEARKHAGLTKVDLARYCGMSKQAIGQIENGTTKEPKPSNLKKIAQICDVRSDWLIDGKGSMTERSSAEPAATYSATQSTTSELLLKLQGKATPRTINVLERLAKVDETIGLSQQDIAIVEAIIARYNEK